MFHVAGWNVQVLIEGNVRCSLECLSSTSSQFMSLSPKCMPHFSSSSHLSLSPHPPFTAFYTASHICTYQYLHLLPVSSEYFIPTITLHLSNLPTLFTHYKSTTWAAAARDGSCAHDLCLNNCVYMFYF